MKITRVIFYEEGLEDYGILCSVEYPAYKKTCQEILAYEALTYYFDGILYELVSISLKGEEDQIFWSKKTGFSENFSATAKFVTCLSRVRQGKYSWSEEKYGKAVFLATYQKK